MIDISVSNVLGDDLPDGAQIFLCNGSKFAVTKDGRFYARKKKYGSLNWVEINKLTEVNGSAYVVSTTKGKRVQFSAAKAVMNVIGRDYGEKGMKIGYVDGDPFNVAFDNLKWVKSNAGRKKKVDTGR